MDGELAGVVEQRADVSLCGALKLCSIVYRSVTVRVVLRFLRVGVIERGAQVCDEVVHREAAGVIDIFPSEVNYSI